MRRFWRRPRRLAVYCDGAIGDRGEGTGLGVIVRDERGEIIGLVKRTLPPMTNNEAEYAALVLALEAAWHFRPRRLEVYMDSEVVIGQMQGRFAVHSPALKRWHVRACRLARRFREVTYHYIPREANRLADALAGEALSEARKEGNDVRRRQL